jgi:rubrerythrin
MEKIELMDLKEILENAILSEELAANFYRDLSSQLDDGLLKDKLSFLSKQEEQHKKLLEEIFEDFYPNEKVEKPKKTIIFECSSYTEKIDSLKTIIQAIEMAMNCEIRAESIYKMLVKKVSKRYAKNLFKYLADMEHSHYLSLKLEYKYMENIGEIKISKNTQYPYFLIFKNH